MVCYGRPPRRSGRRGDGPSVGAVITAEGVFIWKGEFTAKLIAENAESAEIFFNIALRTLRSLR